MALSRTVKHTSALLRQPQINASLASEEYTGLHRSYAPSIVRPLPTWPASAIPLTLGILLMALLLSGCSPQSDSPDSRLTQIANLLGHAVNDSTISLSWTAPADRENNSVTNYDIRYAENAGGLEREGEYLSWPLFARPARPGQPDSATVTFLKRGATYFFAIRGISSDKDTAAASNVAVATTFLDTIPPAAISDLRLTGRSGNTLAVAWTAVGDDGVVGRARSYDIRFAPVSPSAFDFQTAHRLLESGPPRRSGVAEERTIGGLDSRTGYTIAVVSIDEVGGSALPSNLTHGVTDRLSQDWHVEVDGSGDAPSIEAAIDSARGGEWIVLGVGTFFENVTIRNKAVGLRGQGSEKTTLDGSREAASVIAIRGVENGTVKIQAVTIRGGFGSAVLSQPSSPLAGGGLFCQDSNVEVSQCVLRENGRVGPSHADGTVNGGGLYADARNTTGSPHVIIADSYILDNQATANGGGVAIAYGARGTILRSTFVGNRTAIGDGGGVWFLNVSGPMAVMGCTFTANIANDHAGACSFGSNGGTELVLMNCTFDANVARQKDGVPTAVVGGALWLVGVTGIVKNNTFVFNQADVADSARGGSIAVENPHNLSIQRNILAYTVKGGALATTDIDETHCSQNLYWQNEGGNLMQQGSPVGLDMQSSVQDPLFCDPINKVWHPSLESPANLDGEFYLGSLSPLPCGMQPGKGGFTD